MAWASSTSSEAWASSPGPSSGSAGGSPPRAIRFSDPGRPVGHQDLGQLQPGVGHTDQVGHRHQGGGAEHAGDQVEGPLARLGPAPVGHRDERGPEGLEVAQGPDQRGLLGVVLRREELERVGPPLVQQVGDPGHGRTSLPPGRSRHRGRPRSVASGDAPARWSGRSAQPGADPIRVDSRTRAVFSSAAGPGGPRRPGPAAHPDGAAVPWRSSRSASMAKARPRRAPAADVARPPAWGSGAARHRTLEGDGGPLHLDLHRPPDLGVVGLGVAGEQRLPGQLGVGQGRHHRLPPRGLDRLAFAGPPAPGGRPTMARTSTTIRTISPTGSSTRCS